MVEEFRTLVRSTTFSPNRVPLASTVTGAVLTGDELMDTEHWVRQVASPVQYMDALEGALRHCRAGSRVPMVSTLLELGPSPVLTALSRPWITTCFRPSLQWFSSLNASPKMHETLNIGELVNQKSTHLLPNRKCFPWPRLARPAMHAQPKKHFEAVSPNLGVYCINWIHASLPQTPAALASAPSATAWVDLSYSGVSDKDLQIMASFKNAVVVKPDHAGLTSCNAWVVPLLAPGDALANATEQVSKCLLPSKILCLLQKASAFSDQGLCMVTVTCGCDGPVLPNQDPSCLAAGGVYGIIRTARIEMPKVKLITIDTDLLALEEDVVVKSYRQVAAQVVHELQCGDDNTEVAYSLQLSHPVTISSLLVAVGDEGRICLADLAAAWSVVGAGGMGRWRWRWLAACTSNYPHARACVCTHIHTSAPRAVMWAARAASGPGCRSMSVSPNSVDSQILATPAIESHVRLCT